MTSTEILSALLQAVEKRTPVALATVVATDRSVPRGPGTKMLVFADGSTKGTVGGGEMEARVVTKAIEALSSGQSELIKYSLLDAAAGDPGVCGGSVEIYVEPHMAEPTVFVIGLGHVGKAVRELASWLGYRVVGWDDRSELAATVGGSTGPIEDALAEAGVDDQTFIVMTTRNVGLDMEILPPVLATSASFIGLMGSTRRWKVTREKLEATGLEGSTLDRVVSPIGLEIKAESPAEIALSVMAQIVEHQG